MADDTEVISAEAETTTIVVPNANKEAKIILDWDDGQWYVSNIQDAASSIDTVIDGATASDSAGGVKVAVWDKDYKYTEFDIVGMEGMLYVSQQNQNQGNLPSDGTFWWYPVVDLTAVDAVTLEGANLSEIIRLVLGGNLITDYYKKSESDAIILNYINNVNAKKLQDWTLADIKNDYNSIIDAAKASAELGAIEYFTATTNDSYQKSELLPLFDELKSDHNPL